LIRTQVTSSNTTSPNITVVGDRKSQIQNINRLDNNDMEGEIIMKLNNSDTNERKEEIELAKIPSNCNISFDNTSIIQNDQNNLSDLLKKEDKKNNNNSPNNNNTNVNNKPINNGTVMIICTPNATSYEVFAYSDKWIEYYLESGINVFLWNYRGYGKSQGTVSIDNIKKDAECVSDFLKKYYKFNKIGVHGISIGAVASCHLAS
jgi:hypothetical protein